MFHSSGKMEQSIGDSQKRSKDEGSAMAFAHFTLATRDVWRASRFFEAVLGWRPIPRPNNVPMAAAWLEIAPGQELHLVEAADFQPSPFDREFGRHIALAFPEAEFPALKQRLVQHGAELIAPERATPFERFFFRDPNGYVFEIVAQERTAK
jgi:catechol 2,3-dioxygenase-like lactoylglutathione lyase family enzyme